MISLIICLVLLILGYSRPRTIGWIFLLSCPFLASVGNLIFVNDSIYPLRFNQAICAVAIGVSASTQYRSRLIDALKRVRSIWLIAIFLIIEILYALIEPNLQHLKYIVLHQNVLYVAALALSFSLVRDVADLVHVYRAIVITGILIGVLAIIELITGFNVSHYLCVINFSSCKLESLHWPPPTISEGYYDPESRVAIGRYSGVTGEPNLTAYVLAICLVCSYCLLNSLKKWRRYFFFALLSVFVFVLVLSQVRGAIFAYLFTTLAISKLERRVRWFILYLILLAVLLLCFDNAAQEWALQFIRNRLNPEQILTEDQRLRGIRSAAEIIFQSYGLGIGGDIHSASDEYLDSDDVPPILLYFLVGGFLLGLLNLAMQCGIFYSIIHNLKRVPLGKQRAIIVLFIGGMTVAILSSLFYGGTLMFYMLYLYATARASILPLQHSRK